MEEENTNHTEETDKGAPQDTPQDTDRGKLHAIVAYIPFLCFIALFSNDSNEFTRAHGRQGLLLLIIEIIAMFMLLPLGTFFWKMVLLACLILAVAGIVAAFSGRAFTMPFLGKWAEKIK